MKKPLLVLILTSTVLFGQNYIEVDRMKSMQDMEVAMATIQKGFLFNNVHVVRNGVKDLKVSVKNTESFIKEGVNDKGVNTLVYAKRQAIDIAKFADDILKTFEKGDQYGAANGYMKVLSKCLSCHQTIRSW